LRLDFQTLAVYSASKSSPNGCKRFDTMVERTKSDRRDHSRLLTALMSDSHNPYATPRSHAPPKVRSNLGFSHSGALPEHRIALRGRFLPDAQARVYWEKNQPRLWPHFVCVGLVCAASVVIAVASDDKAFQVLWIAVSAVVVVGAIGGPYLNRRRIQNTPVETIPTFEGEISEEGLSLRVQWDTDSHRGDAQLCYRWSTLLLQRQGDTYVDLIHQSPNGQTETLTLPSDLFGSQQDWHNFQSFIRVAYPKSAFNRKWLSKAEFWAFVILIGVMVVLYFIARYRQQK
jgi:hypothetical protein